MEEEEEAEFMVREERGEREGGERGNRRQWARDTVRLWVFVGG